MKLSELIIGALVTTKLNPTQYYSVSSINACNEICFLTPIDSPLTHVSYKLDEIIGIEITEEFLKNNGFSDYGDGTKKYCIFECGSELLQVTLEHTNAGIYIFGPMIDDKLFNLWSIKYIHELQMLLEVLKFPVEFKI